MKIQSSQAKAVEDRLWKPQALALRDALWRPWGRRKEPACSRVWKYNMTSDCKRRFFAWRMVLAVTLFMTSTSLFGFYGREWHLKQMCSSEEKKNTLFVEENNAGC